MKSLLVLFVVISFFAMGESLKCYVCSNPPNPGCNDPFDKSAEGVTETTLDRPANCTKLTFEIDSKKYTSRNIKGAGKAASEFETGRGDWIEMVNTTMYYCDTDLCNGGTSVTVALSTLMTLAMILISTNY